MEGGKKIRIKCGNCKSENVARDAEARFNFDSQEWELSAVYDAAYCHGNSCRDSKLIEEPVEEPTPIKYVCPECGSENVVGKVYDARWNKEEQRWTTEGPDDRMFCNGCENEGWAEAKPVDEQRPHEAIDAEKDANGDPIDKSPRAQIAFKAIMHAIREYITATDIAGTSKEVKKNDIDCIKEALSYAYDEDEDEGDTEQTDYQIPSCPTCGGPRHFSVECPNKVSEETAPYGRALAVYQ